MEHFLCDCNYEQKTQLGIDNKISEAQGIRTTWNSFYSLPVESVVEIVSVATSQNGPRVFLTPKVPGVLCRNNPEPCDSVLLGQVDL